MSRYVSGRDSLQLGLAAGGCREPLGDVVAQGTGHAACVWAGLWVGESRVWVKLSKCGVGDLCPAAGGVWLPGGLPPHPRVWQLCGV